MQDPTKDVNEWSDEELLDKCKSAVAKKSQYSSQDIVKTYQCNSQDITKNVRFRNHNVTGGLGVKRPPGTRDSPQPYTHLDDSTEHSSTSGDSSASSFKTATNLSTEQHYCSRSIILCSVFFLILVVVSTLVYQSNGTIESPTSEKMAEEIYKLVSSFPQQSESVWISIVSGVKSLYTSDPKQPCVLLLVLNNYLMKNKDGTSECIAQLVANKVTTDLGYNNRPAVVEASEVTANDYGEVLQSLKDKIMNQKALILTNLQDLSGKVAESLHVLCDRISPAVPEALLLFTMKVEMRKESENDRSFVQRVLTKLWKDDIHPDKLPALVARISDSVISINPETTLPEDCIKLTM